MSRNLSCRTRPALILSGIFAVLGVLAGCGQQTTRLNVPPQGDKNEAEPNEMQPFFAYSADNAMLSDQSLADIHFVPHTTELNSLGTTRLTRMAHFLNAYGGTVRYAPEIADQMVINTRMEHVKEYLSAEGVDMARVTVQVARAGSNYTPATRAVAAMQQGLAVKHSDSEESASGGSSGGASGGSSK